MKEHHFETNDNMCRHVMRLRCLEVLRADGWGARGALITSLMHHNFNLEMTIAFFKLAISDSYCFSLSHLTSQCFKLRWLQDALVLELRTTIKTLRMENRQLANAMAQLNAGADATDVMSALPERLKVRERLDSSS